jgi:hypothetical protein
MQHLRAHNGECFSKWRRPPHTSPRPRRDSHGDFNTLQLAARPVAVMILNRTQNAASNDLDIAGCRTRPQSHRRTNPYATGHAGLPEQRTNLRNRNASPSTDQDRFRERDHHRVAQKVARPRGLRLASCTASGSNSARKPAQKSTSCSPILPPSQEQTRRCIFLEGAYTRAPETRESLVVIAQLTMEVQPIEVNGKWWVAVSLNGRAMKRRGPFPSADAAQTAAGKLIREWQSPNLPATKNDVVVLHGKPTELTSDEGRRFVTDACRSGEGVLDDATLREIYEITSDKDWADIAANTALGRAIRDERKRRIRNGQAAREAACEYYAKAPTAMNAIMTDSKSPTRARIEAAREIRTQAIGGDGAENTLNNSEKYIIRIDLTAAPDGNGEVLEIAATPNQPKQIEGEANADERV